MLFAETRRFVPLDVSSYCSASGHQHPAKSRCSLRSVWCWVAEISNLLVKRQGGDLRTDSGSLELNLTQLRFHQIKDKEITQVIRNEPMLDCDKNTRILPCYRIKTNIFYFLLFKINTCKYLCCLNTIACCLIITLYVLKYYNNLFLIFYLKAQI